MTLLTIDVETTGLNAWRDRIVQVALIQQNETKGSLSIVEWSSLVNPGVHIPSSATKIHGIDDERVKDAPTFAELADTIAGFFVADDGGFSDICGYNVSFDLGFLRAEYERVGLELLGHKRIYDPLIFFRKWERRNLSNAVRFYLNEEHEQAHDALGDARATLRVLMAQRDRYGVGLEEL